ncbi:hypoxia induced protein conserved region-domain-containing protein, partial [Lentinula edodes]
EGYKEKAIRKTKENPWVPLGTLVTTGALTMAAIRLRQGNSRKFQVWLRFRVAFQALTIFAILGGLYKYGQANLEENQRIMEQINQQRGEKHLAMERAELEQRIADATKAHEEQQLL